MRLPRIRFTIGRLMVAVLLMSLALWWAFVIRPRQGGPTLAEFMAEAEYKRARLALEIAGLADAQFSKGVDLRNVEEIRGTAALAGSDLERAIDRLRWSEKMHAKGFVSEATKIADRLTMERAGFEVDQARDQLESLRKSAKTSPTGPPKGDVEKARAVEQAKLEAFRKERSQRLGWIGR